MIRGLEGSVTRGLEGSINRGTSSLEHHIYIPRN